MHIKIYQKKSKTRKRKEWIKKFWIYDNNYQIEENFLPLF